MTDQPTVLCGERMPLLVVPAAETCSRPVGHPPELHRSPSGTEWGLLVHPAPPARLIGRERSAIHVVLRFLDDTGSADVERVRDAIAVLRELAGAIGAELEWHAIDKLLATPHPARGNA